MNICMFSRIMPAHSKGGMQDHVQSLSAGLVKRNHRVVVITTARTDGIEFEQCEGVEIFYLLGSIPGEYSRAWWYESAAKCVELHRASPFQVLHSQSAGGYGVYKKNVPRELGLPLVTSLHGTHLDVLTTTWHTDFSFTHPIGMARFFALSADLGYRYVRDLPFLRAADVLIATSDKDVEKYQQLYRISPDRIRKVYNGIDTNLFAPISQHLHRTAFGAVQVSLESLQSLRRHLKIKENERLILALARLQKEKGVQNAIEVMSRLRDKFDATLIVVGEGDYRAALETLARSRGMADHVRFVGAQSLEECARYFQVCDVFVDPTLRTDGYDLTIAEAMACAKPVIASDVGANATLIDAANYRDGILIPRGDNAALAREIDRVLSDAELANAMGQRARAKIASRFSLEAMVEGMEKVYAEMAR